MIQKIRSTEKIVKMIESDNTLVFETDIKVMKPEMKAEVEKLFNVKVKSVNTHIRRNKKIVFVRLMPEFPAIDVATKLGLM
jgi:ribosomal protein L23